MIIVMRALEDSSYVKSAGALPRTIVSAGSTVALCTMMIDRSSCPEPLCVEVHYGHPVVMANLEADVLVAACRGGRESFCLSPHETCCMYDVWGALDDNSRPNEGQCLPR
jgi:hypothetical protein